MTAPPLETPTGEVLAPDPTFYVGLGEPGWLARTDRPACVSHTRLARRRSLPVARGPWVLDSGGYTHLLRHGRWLITPAGYVDAVRRYRDEIGGLVWAAAQDWMCEPHVLAATGRTAAQHQAATVENYLTLLGLAPDLPWLPVVQGWCVGSYRRCVGMYAAAGIDLAALPAVGVGSVCGRPSALSVALVIDEVHQAGVTRLHGFGIKTDALPMVAEQLVSADSQAWSLAAAYRGEPCPLGRRDCRNCLHAAEEWHHEITGRWRHLRRPAAA